MASRSTLRRPLLATTLGIALLLMALSGFLAFSPTAAATPWSGPEPTPTNLLLYLHNSSLGVTVGSQTFNDVLSTLNDTSPSWLKTGGLSVGVHYDSVSFAVAPQLAAPLTLNGTVMANMWLNESGSSPNGGSLVVTVDELSGAGAVSVLGTGPANPSSPLGPGGSIPKLIALTGPSLNQTVPAGDSLIVNVTISGNTAEGYGIWWGDVAGSYYFSDVAIPASTYLTVSPVQVTNATGQVVTDLPANVADKTVTITATVSDPLGAYDFEAYPVDFSVFNASLVRVVGPLAMAPSPGLAPGAAAQGNYTLSFNYSSLPAGIYNFSVNSTDNTNHDLWGQSTPGAYFGRAASGSIAIAVGLPPVHVLVQVRDAANVTLPGAVVRAFSAGTLVAHNRTNGTGFAAMELPGGSSYEFEVLWEGVPAGTFPGAVGNASTTLVLHALVFSPVFRLASSGGIPLPYALVSVVHPNGTTLPLEVTSAQGTFTLGEVPQGNYTLTVIYDDTEVVAASVVSMTGNGPWTVTVADVFPLTISTTTSTGASLSGVFVQVRNASTQATVASGITNQSGNLVFLVPAGSYQVLGEWSATYDLTALQQSVNTSVSVSGPTATTLEFTSAYPGFASTTLFDYVVVIVVLVVLLVIVGMLWIRERRGKGRKSSPTPTSEWRETPSSSPVAVPSESPGPGAETHKPEQP